MDNNMVTVQKKFNTGKNLLILIGVSFGIFMIGMIFSLLINNMTFDQGGVPLQKLLVSLSSIFQITIPMMTLIIGIPIILILGYNNNKKNQ